MLRAPPPQNKDQKLETGGALLNRHAIPRASKSAPPFCWSVSGEGHINITILSRQTKQRIDIAAEERKTITSIPSPPSSTKINERKREGGGIISLYYIRNKPASKPLDSETFPMKR